MRFTHPRRTLPVVTLFVVMANCDRCQEATPPEYLATIDGSVATGVRVVPTVGTGTVEVPVLLLNSYGAPITGGSIEVSVNGPSAVAASTTVNTDTWGYATVEVDTTTPEAFVVTAVSSSDGATPEAPETCWSVSPDFPDLALMPAWPLDTVTDAVSLITVTSGYLLAGTNEVWFLPATQGAPPHSVLYLTDPILRISPLHVDADGVVDALIYTAAEVVLLRGRASGGMSWGTGFQVQNGLSISAVSTGDVNADQNTDLAVALTDGAETTVQFLAGDGTWAFINHSTLPFGYTISDLLLAQSDNDDKAETNLLTNASVLVRYSFATEGWMETGPSNIETNLDAPAGFLGATDLNGEGTDDLILTDPVGMESRTALFYTMEGSATRYTETRTSFDGALGDITGDGIDDLLLLEEGQLWYLSAHTDPADEIPAGTFMKRNVLGLADAGPIAVSNHGGVGLMDLAVASEGLWVYPGKEGTSIGHWAPSEVDWTSYTLNQFGPLEGIDADADGLLDYLVSFLEDADGVVSMGSWALLRDEAVPSLDSITRLVLDGATPVAMTRCGTRLFVLLDSWESDLIAVDIDDEGVLTLAAQGDATGGLLACGDLADGAVVAVSDESGNAVTYDQDLAAVGAVTLDNPVAMAAADPDGDGIDELVSCDDTSCSMLALDMDGDGLDEIVRSAKGALYVEGWGSEQKLEGSGQLSRSDVDGDGFLDVIASDAGMMWIYRGVTGGLAPALGQHTRTDMDGAPAMGDWDGDGQIDIYAGDGLGHVMVARDLLPE